MTVYVVFYNERSCNIAKIFDSMEKARKFIEDGNGKYMDIVDTYTVE